MKIVNSSQTWKLVAVILILDRLLSQPNGSSILMGGIFGISIIGVLWLTDGISRLDLLTGVIPTLIAVFLTRHIPLASALTGIVLGIILSSYVLAPGSKNLKKPLGRILGILIAILGSYFVSFAWGELITGVAVGVLFTGLLPGTQRQPQSTANLIIHS